MVSLFVKYVVQRGLPSILLSLSPQRTRHAVQNTDFSDESINLHHKSEVIVERAVLKAMWPASVFHSFRRLPAAKAAGVSTQSLVLLESSISRSN